jgi:DNA repair protein RecN (Recombination protein N)
MLTHLLIKNYALIKHLEISPSKGLNIITGETGAGKSIMLGALGLLMGNRADTKALFDENEKCVVEGIFDIKLLNLKYFFEENELDFEENCLIRREISTAGKSRAFVNDTPVTLEILKNLGANLMDIHSQNDTLSLGSNAYQLAIVDTFAQNQTPLENYKNAFLKYKEAEKNYILLQKNASALKKEFDYNSFLFEELLEAKLTDDEQSGLEQELFLLENAEEVKRKLNLTFQYLNNTEQSVLSLLKDANASMAGISSLSTKYKSLKDRINSCIIEIQDITDEIENIESKLEIDDNQVVLLRERLNLIFKLHQKHDVKTNADLIIIREDLKQKVEKVLNLSEELVVLEKTKNEEYLKVSNLANSLSESRKSVLPKFVNKIQQLFTELGMPDAQMNIVQKPKELATEGQDEIVFEFNANKGSSAKPLKEVASGGEFSRLMLALKYILAEKRQLATIIFDEIDTGISGEVALKVGKIMTEMAKNMQVVAITHLHQIAGKGQTHFYVYKDNSSARTISLMRKLDNEERIVEVAKMIGGQNPSESAIKNAIEMLGIEV